MEVVVAIISHSLTRSGTHLKTGRLDGKTAEHGDKGIKGYHIDDDGRR